MNTQPESSSGTSWWPYGLIAAGVFVVTVNMVFIYIAQTNRPEIVPSYAHDAGR